MTGKAHQAERSLALLQAGGVANRVLATADGTTMALQQATVGMLAAGVAVRAATRVVATTNPARASSVPMQQAADYVCDGTADDVEINAALASLPASGGTVLLAEGQYVLAAAITLGSAGCVLRGMGMDITYLLVAPSGGAPINTNLLVLNADYTEITDLTVDGNKANNVGQTGMTLMCAVGTTGSLIQRVRMLNSAQYGLVVHTTVRDGVVRDCLIEGAVLDGATLRAEDGRPLVVSGCTSTGSGRNGLVCDAGPVALSDCQALNNTTAGFAIPGTSAARLNNCVAIGNGYGFDISAPRAVLINCRATTNVNYGFRTTGSQALLVGCLSDGTTPGSGFTNDTGAADTLHVGCTAVDSRDTGFYHAASGRATYVGCTSLNDYNTGFNSSLSGATIHLQGCYVYGALTGYGLYFYGAASIVAGCRVVHVGGEGLQIASADSLLVGNSVSESGLSANNSYGNITLSGAAGFVHNNVSRDPPSGNRTWCGIYITASAANSLLGQNDAYGSGTGGTPPYEVYVEATTARRTARLRLDYTPTTDIAGGPVVANTWTDILTNQSFVVGSPGSLVEITCRGSALGGNMTPGSPYVARLAIDDGAIIKMLGGETIETSLSGYQNVLGSGHPVKLQGLAAGTHTVRLQVNSYYASYIYFRCATAANQEYLRLQVVEYAR